LKIIRKIVVVNTVYLLLHYIVVIIIGLCSVPFVEKKLKMKREKRSLIGVKCVLLCKRKRHVYSIMKYNISNIVSPTLQTLKKDLSEINFTGFYIILFALAMDKFIFSRIADALC
tara:strand:- start:183 stop:527 length:345 start_codon:yes stop_codon:yes gene_type:complete